MRIVVQGQLAFGKAVLEALLERGENIVGVTWRRRSPARSPIRSPLGGSKRNGQQPNRFNESLMASKRHPEETHFLGTHMAKRTGRSGGPTVTVAPLVIASGYLGRVTGGGCRRLARLDEAACPRLVG